MSKLPSPRFMVTHLRPENLPKSIFQNNAKVSADFNVLKKTLQKIILFQKNQCSTLLPNFRITHLLRCLAWPFLRDCLSTAIHLTEPQFALIGPFRTVSTRELQGLNKSSRGKMDFDGISYGRNFMALLQVRVSMCQISRSIYIFVNFPCHLKDDLCLYWSKHI